jgi:hypothetical protein
VQTAAVLKALHRPTLPALLQRAVIKAERFTGENALSSFRGAVSRHVSPVMAPASSEASWRRAVIATRSCGQNGPMNPETTPMIRHPIEANFYVDVSEADVEVIFAPTRSRYTYSRLVDADLGLLSPNPLVRHGGRNGGTGDYEPEEVQAMAYRVALATARRLRRSAKPPAAGR